MTPESEMTDALTDAVAALGSGCLTEQSLRKHIFPLFTGVLSNESIYMANHSLGRPLNQSRQDICEAFSLWQTKLGDAWDDWLAERESHRSRLAKLIGASRADCVVPKTSAGQGLRTVLNALPDKALIVTTRGEFDSVDLILKQYAALGRIRLQFVETEPSGFCEVERLIETVTEGVALVVVSQVMFMTGQRIHQLDPLASVCHRVGARLLIDAYHSVGVFPVDVAKLNADFMIGGCYKYLRGGPGACFLYISPNALKSGLAPLDTGWFAKANPFLYERPDPPILAAGGDAFLESTPPALTYYQARAGLRFTLEVGVERLRTYSLDRLTRLQQYLAERGVAAQGADADHGAFLAIRLTRAADVAEKLAARGLTADARGQWLRLSPDCLTRDNEMLRAAQLVSSVVLQS